MEDYVNSEVHKSSSTQDTAERQWSFSVYGDNLIKNITEAIANLNKNLDHLWSSYAKIESVVCQLEKQGIQDIQPVRVKLVELESKLTHKQDDICKKQEKTMSEIEALSAKVEEIQTQLKSLPSSDIVAQIKADVSCIKERREKSFVTAFKKLVNDQLQMEFPSDDFQFSAAQGNKRDSGIGMSPFDVRPRENSFGHDIVMPPIRERIAQQDLQQDQQQERENVPPSTPNRPRSSSMICRCSYAQQFNTFLLSLQQLLESFEV